MQDGRGDYKRTAVSKQTPTQSPPPPTCKPTMLDHSAVDTPTTESDATGL